jgi:hypothetical protein
MRIVLAAVAAALLPAAVPAATTDPVCTAHARQLATEFRAVEAQAGAHPLDMQPVRLEQVLTDYSQSADRTEKDLARRVILTMQIAMQAGCRDIRDDLQRLR